MILLNTSWILCKGKKTNKNTFTTTVGRWIYNKYFIEPHLFDILGYVNTNLTKGEQGKINEKLSYAVLEDKISVEDLKDYIMKTQFFQPFVNIYSPSYTLDMLLVTKSIQKKKRNS